MNYVVSTIAYGVVSVLAAIAALIFFLTQRYFVMIICLAMLGVAADNFFCAHRARLAGFNVNGEYCIPFSPKHHK